MCGSVDPVSTPPTQFVTVVERSTIDRSTDNLGTFARSRSAIHNRGGCSRDLMTTSWPDEAGTKPGFSAYRTTSGFRATRFTGRLDLSALLVVIDVTAESEYQQTQEQEDHDSHADEL
jgi:hypothetical protein